jgi:Transposase DDE domain
VVAVELVDVDGWDVEAGDKGGVTPVGPELCLDDRGYDNRNVRHLVAAVGITDLVCSRLRPRGTATTKKLVPLGMRWPIERTNSWLSNFGQLRRNTDRRATHRLAQIALAIVLLFTAKLID